MTVLGMYDVYTDVILVHVVCMTNERSEICVLRVNRNTKKLRIGGNLFNPLGSSITL
jgi:hypothetical protein